VLGDLREQRGASMGSAAPTVFIPVILHELNKSRLVRIGPRTTALPVLLRCGATAPWCAESRDIFTGDGKQEIKPEARDGGRPMSSSALDRRDLVAFGKCRHETGIQLTAPCRQRPVCSGQRLAWMSAQFVSVALHFRKVASACSRSARQPCTDHGFRRPNLAASDWLYQQMP
jgi:hypothetical protein